MATSLSQVQRVRLLYKGILRLHRGLPDTMRQIGDGYVKEEFRKHKTANQLQSVIFMQEWTKYYVTLANQMGKASKGKTVGQNLSEQVLDDFTNDQIVQLHDLYKELKTLDDHEQAQNLVNADKT